MRDRSGQQDWPQWRNACVVRASTIAENLRMIEFAVEGGLAAFGSDARTRVRALCAEADGDGRTTLAAGSYVCVNVGEGRMRVLVPAPDGGAGARFMWSLIEGARVRLTVPAGLPANASPVRLAGATGMRICVAAGGPYAAAQLHLAARAANANAQSRQNFSF